MKKHSTTKVFGDDGHEVPVSHDLKYAKVRGRWRRIQKDRAGDTFVKCPGMTWYDILTDKK